YASPGPTTSKRPAATESATPTTSSRQTQPQQQERQYEATVPTVRDRIVQAAMKIVLEPIFEADMLPCSFGFRPRRSTHDALQVLVDESWRGRRWVVETDIANCLKGLPTWRIVRYADDSVVLVYGSQADVEALRENITHC